MRDNGDVRFYLSACALQPWRCFIQHYLSECVGRHQTVLIVNVVHEKQTRTPFKGENVKALIKTLNCEKLVLYFSEKSQKIAAFAFFFFGFQ